ncbi:hypothetical protein GIB67_038952, partial [Kingdonia uniflora]
MGEGGYYCSKKTDDSVMMFVEREILEFLTLGFENYMVVDLLIWYEKDARAAFSMSRVRCISAVRLQSLPPSIHHCSNLCSRSLFAWTEDHIFPKTNMGISPKPFNEIPHYYHENVSMENLCRLHGGGTRESPRRVFDAVLFSNEVDILTIRLERVIPIYYSIRSTRIKFDVHWFKKGENPFVEEAYQRVALDQLLKIAGISDNLLIMSDVDEIPSSHTIISSDGVMKSLKNSIFGLRTTYTLLNSQSMIKVGEHPFIGIKQ